MKNNPGFTDSGQTHMFTSFPETHQDDESDDILNNDINRAQQTTLIDQNFLEEKTYSIWQLEYYQKYFNVNTSDVLARIVGSVVPSFRQNSLIDKIRPNPDLYGPFWITTTLIFTIAIAGNIVSFIRNFGNYSWQTDFHKVTSSALAIIAYSWITPAILYIIMRWRQTRSDFEFIEILCIYGYSLSIYIPVSILWLIHVSFLQWTFTIIAVILSGSVLFLTFWPVFSQDNNKKITIAVMGMIVLFHALLGIGFMLYFFHYPTNPINIITTTATIQTTNMTSNVTLISQSS